MKQNTLTLTVAALAGCTDPAPEVIFPASLDDGFVTQAEHLDDRSGVEDSIRRLEGLEIVVVGDLIVDAPRGPADCDGLPCADDPVDQGWMVEHAVQAARLEGLVQVAEDVSSRRLRADEDTIYASIEALQALEIVENVGVYDSSGNHYASSATLSPLAGQLQALAEQAQEL